MRTTCALLLLAGLAIAACGRSALAPELGLAREAGPVPPVLNDYARPDGSSSSGSGSDAGLDPDDAPWLGDTSPFDPTRVTCMDVDAGLACGILTPKQLEAICAGRGGNLAFEAERLAMEALNTLVADPITSARVLAELAELRRRVPRLEETTVFVYAIPEAGPFFSAEEYLTVRLGAHDGFNCLVTSLNARVTRFSDSMHFFALTWKPELHPFIVTHLFLDHTDAYRFGWSAAAYHPCSPDICLSIEGSRFSYVFKTGDCRAPSYETYTVGLDGGVTVQPGWDRERRPWCSTWFDQVRWL